MPVFDITLLFISKALEGVLLTLLVVPPVALCAPVVKRFLKNPAMFSGFNNSWIFANSAVAKNSFLVQ